MSPPSISAHDASDAQGVRVAWFRRLMHDRQEKKSGNDKLVPVLAFVGFGFLSLSLGKDANWDLYNYHYYNAYAFLHNRLDVDYAPAGLHTYLNPTLDVIFYVLAELLPAPTVGFLMGALHGLNFWLIYGIVTTIHLHYLPNQVWLARVVGVVCAGVGMYSPTGMGLLGTTTNDLFISIFVLTALWWFLLYLGDGPRNGLALLAGSAFVLGFAVGAKLTAVMFLPGMVLLILMAGWRHHHLWTTLLVYSVFGLGGFLLSNGYWMYALYSRYGNPFFPFYNGFFRSAYWVPVNFSDARWGAGTVKEFLLFPYSSFKNSKITVEVDQQDCRYLVAFGCMCALFLGALVEGAFSRVTRQQVVTIPKRPTNFLAVALVGFFLATYFTWLALFAYGRYSAVLELLAPTVIYTLFLGSFKNIRWTILLAAACFLVIVVEMRAPDWGRLSWSDSYMEVRVPPVTTGDDVLVLITASEPCSHVIPAFPSNCRFVRLQGFFMAPEPVDAVQAALRKRIRSHSGRVFLLTDENHDNPPVLRKYGIIVKPGYRTIVSDHGRLHWIEAVKS
jgi:hypothetical protein